MMVACKVSYRPAYHHTPEQNWMNDPNGLILCSEGNTEHIQYLMMDEKSDIRVAQYFTQLPDQKLLADKLQRAIAIAREKQQENKQLGKNENLPSDTKMTL
ncbi:MAG: hypothetical protein MJZ75_04150 [Paludibacteraceae bacterium]|nr:hypothetical protein [Paludibacteraceae bacterium]